MLPCSNLRTPQSLIEVPHLKVRVLEIRRHISPRLLLPQVVNDSVLHRHLQDVVYPRSSKSFFLTPREIHQLSPDLSFGPGVRDGKMQKPVIGLDACSPRQRRGSQSHLINVVGGRSKTLLGKQERSAAERVVQVQLLVPVPLGVEVQSRHRDQISIARQQVVVVLNPLHQARIQPSHLGDGGCVDGGGGGNDLYAEFHLSQHVQHDLLSALRQGLLPRLADEEDEGLEAHELVPYEGCEGEDEGVLRVAVRRHHRPALPVGLGGHERAHGIELEALAEEEEGVDTLVDLQHFNPPQLKELCHLSCCRAEGGGGARGERKVHVLLYPLTPVLVHEETLYHNLLRLLPVHHPSFAPPSEGNLPRVRVHEQIHQTEGRGMRGHHAAGTSMHLDGMPSDAQVNHPRLRRLLSHLQLGCLLPVDHQHSCCLLPLIPLPSLPELLQALRLFLQRLLHARLLPSKSRACTRCLVLELVDRRRSLAARRRRRRRWWWWW
mmetsp:Transcript_38762/g.122159  ORF Transcript_38762/g.122159 Transcript_38762/m.122159 type:complete len:492 (+) Transcript_38762:1229-2704(+)